MKHFYRKGLLFLGLLAAFSFSYGQSTAFYQVDFETPGGYTPSVTEFSDGFGDYFTRTDGSNISANFSNVQGSFYFAAQDIDGEGASAAQTILFEDIDISGQTDLGLSIFLAEDDDGSNQDWDGSDYFQIAYDIDNSGVYTELLHVRSTLGTNGEPLIDTDFDGVGDGTAVTNTFQEFTAAIPETGNSIDIRISISLNSGDEDIAFDNLAITAPDVTPPVISAFSIENINSTNFELDAQLDESGTFYYTVLADGSAAPTALEVKSGNATGEVTSGSRIILEADVLSTNQVTGLVEGDTYDVYLVAEDGNGNLTADGDVVAIADITTAPDTQNPTVVSAVTQGSGDHRTIVLALSEFITVTDQTGFSVAINGQSATITNFFRNAEDLFISLAESIYAGDVVTFSYDQTGDAQDAATNPLSVYTDEPVVNNATLYFVNDIAAARALGVGAEVLIEGEVFVSYTRSSGPQVYVQDADAGLVLDETDLFSINYNVGDGITGIEGSLRLNNDVLELVPTVDPGAATSTGNTITPLDVSIADFNASVETYENRILRFTEVSFVDAGTDFGTGSDNYDVTDGVNTLTWRDNFFEADYSSFQIPFGRVDLVALGSQFRGSPQAIPFSQTEAILDNYDPVYFVEPAAGTPTALGVDITFRADEEGTFYYYAVADGTTPAPTVEEVMTSGVAVSYTDVAVDVVVSIDLMDNTAYDIYTVIADDEVVPNVQASTIMLDVTTPELVVDQNTDITGPAIQAPEAVVNATSNAAEAAFPVFNFTIFDEGTDGISTLIDAIVIEAGAANTAAWSTTLGGGSLVVGQIEYDVVIADDSITLDLAGSEFEIANGTSVEASLSVWFSTAVTDGDVVQMEIPTDHDFSALTTNSLFLPTLNAAVTGNTQTISVEATGFELLAPVGGVTSGSTFDVTVAAIDENGNIDTDARNVSISATGAGNLTGTNLAAQAMTDGLYTWTGLGFDSNGDYVIAVDDDASALTASTATITVFDQVGDLFISEYIEGGSNNKAVEIYNNLGGPADLSKYTVGLYSNGSAEIGNNIVLSEIQPVLDQGEVLVIVNPGSVPALLDVANAENSITFFNGDDALALLKDDVIIDAFGDIGTDPGSNWDVAGVAGATSNQTLVRKGTVAEGNPVNLASFGTDEASSEWIVYSQDDFGYIGYHLLEGETIPLITLTTDAFDGSFGFVENGSSSDVRSYDVSAVDLIGDLTITPPEGFEIAAEMDFSGTVYDNGTPWVITPTNNDVLQTVYVRFTPLAVDVSYAGDIVHTSASATERTVAVAGVEGAFTVPSLSGIVINEMLPDPNGSQGFEYDTDGSGSADTADEFVEIYNSSEAGVDISGWQLWDESGMFHEFPAATTLGAGNYAGVLAGLSGGSLPATSDGNLAFVASSSMSISNGGENLALYNPNSGEYIQMLFNGDSEYDFSAAISGSSPASVTEDWGSDVDGSSLVREPAGSATIVVHGNIQGADAASFAEPTIDPNAPAIAAELGSFSAAFGNVLLGQESATSTYSVSAINLSADLVITAPAGFEIASDGATFGSTVTLTPVSQEVAATTITVKYVPTGEGSEDGAILHESTAAPTIELEVSGAGITDATIFFEGFGSCDALNSFTTQSVSGDNEWECSDNGATGGAAAMSGFSFGSFSGVVNEDWLISPAIDLSSVGAARLSFDTDVAFDGTGTLTVQYSADFSGDVTTATWTELSATFDVYTPETENDGVFVNSGDIDLAGGSPIYLAFKYVSEDDPEGAVEYRVDNILVTEREAEWVVNTSGFVGDYGTQEVGTQSVGIPVSVEGFALTADATVTAPAQFELALSSDFSNASASLTLTPVGGVISEDVYIRFAPTTVGQVSGDVVFSTTGFDDVNLSVSGTGTEPVLGLGDGLAITVYPNPVQDVFEITNESGKQISVRLYSLDGSQMNITRQGEQYNIGSLNAGVYILVVRDGAENELARRQIIKR